MRQRWRMTRRATAVLGLLCVLACVGLVAALFRHSSGQMDPIRGDLEAELVVPGRVEVDLAPGRHDLWGIDPTGEAFDDAHDVDLAFTVTGPDGDELVIDPNRAHPGYHDPDSSAVLAVQGGVDIPRAGAYVIEAAPTDDGIATTRAGIGPPVRFTMPIPIVAGFFAFALAAAWLLFTAMRPPTPSAPSATLAA